MIIMRRLNFWGFSFGLRVLICLALSVCFVRGEHLPVRTFTSADGLGSSSVTGIMRDSRGFLWFSTRDGISRFDGQFFQTYHLPEGASPNVIQVLERRNGDYFAVAQTGGVYRFNAGTTVSSENTGVFSTLNAEKIYDDYFGNLYEDSAGRLWSASVDKGLLQIEEKDGKFVFTPFSLQIAGEPVRPTRIMEMSDGSFWLLTETGVVRLAPDLRVLETYETKSRSQISEQLTSLFEDRNGLVWIGSVDGTFILKPGNLSEISSFTARQLAANSTRKAGEMPQDSGEIVALTTSATLGGKVTRDFYQAADGRIFIATDDGLTIFDGHEFREFTSANGLGNPLSQIETDGDGNLWISSTSGVFKLAVNGFSTYQTTDGLGGIIIDSIYQDEHGEIYVANDLWKVSRFDGKSFETVQPNLGANVGIPLWTSNVSFLDREGSWWFLTEKKLFRYDNVGRFEDLKSRSPSAVYESGESFLNGAFYRLFEDSHGDIWISIRSSKTSRMGLRRLNRANGTLQAFTAADNFPAERSPASFAEDWQGNLWIGFYTGGLVRFRDGRFDVFSNEDGLPKGGILSLHTDKAGRLWLASAEGGLSRIDDTSAAKPAFTTYTIANGLSSNNVRTVTEDDAGRIYIGTVRGIDRISLETGKIRHFTVADGLANEFVTTAFKDGTGVLWFGTRNGLSRFVPESEKSWQAPAILIRGLRVAGVKQAVSELGQQEVPDLKLDYTQANLQIDFLSIGPELRYQYRLEGADKNWSQPTFERTINFSNLAPGDYKFLVRAVNSDGIVSENPAIVSFSISPPFWRTWQFLLGVFLFLGALVFLFERYRAGKHRLLHKAFDEIKTSENRFRKMVEQSPLGIIILSPDGQTRTINQAYLEMWGEGATYEQIIGWDLQKDEQMIQGGVIAGLKRVFEGEFVKFDPVCYNLKKNGAGIKHESERDLVWIEAVAYPVKNSKGELREVICVLEDITEKKMTDEKLEKARSERERELEQVRRRIATDLHDDIGSSLTQISILSEVLQQRIDSEQTAITEPLTIIADSSRELVDAMSDIVWAINPQKDYLRDLIQRMRRFAADIFTARRIKFSFEAPEAEIEIGANVRREVFLIFKESINNIIKHSGCTFVEINLTVDKKHLRLSVSDNGCGFIPVEPHLNGHGLASMRERALGFGGKVEITSNDKGTLLILDVILTEK